MCFNLLEVGIRLWVKLPLTIPNMDALIFWRLHENSTVTAGRIAPMTKVFHYQLHSKSVSSD